jgi:phage-related protein
MPLPLSSVAIEEKNRLATDSVWFVCLEITIPGGGDPIRVVRNNENITWRGETWVAFPFELEELEEGKGEVPKVVIRVSNVSRAMELYLQNYDVYTKTNGYSPITVSIFVLNSLNLASDTPEVEHLFELMQPKTNAQWATFVLGASNPFNKRYPQARILKGHCRFVFKGALCGYAGAESACDKTLPRCRELDNSPRFGGFPGAGYGGLRLV